MGSDTIHEQTAAHSHALGGRWQQGAAMFLDLNPSTLLSRMQKLDIRKAKATA
jgi:transcriptional regulator with GAF, ATPase, and Fis domain